MSPLAVSVIIPTRNRQKRLAETMACLRRQTLPACDYEIVVVDDGSAPPVELPRGQHGPACRLVRLAGVERSAARNAGAAAALGELLVFVDDDMFLPPEFLEAHLQAQRHWPGVLLIGAIRLPAEVLATPFGRFRQRLEDTGTPRAEGLAVVPNFCAAGNMAMARARLLELGGFDRELVSGEDQDLALRHTAQGGQIAFVPKAEAGHHDSALDIRSYCQRVEWGSESLIPFCRRHAELADNVARHRINGPIRWSQGPVAQVRKLLKAGLAAKPVVAALFGLASVLERWAPHSWSLDRVYRLLLGAHVFRGYRKGLKRFGAVDTGKIGGPRSRVLA